MRLEQKLVTLGLTIVLIGSSLVTSIAKQNLKVEFINVGAGDSIYIELPNGYDILIDAGTASNGKKVVNKLLKEESNM